MIVSDLQLQTHAHEFALTDEITRPQCPTSAFWSTFASDVKSLHDFAEMLGQERATCGQPAEDWLLEHIAFIETQAQVVKREQKARRFTELPHLRTTSVPRIFALCDDYLEQVGGEYGVDTLEVYIKSYQQVDVLNVRECSIVPMVMRIAILSRLAESMREVRHRHEICLESEDMIRHISKENITEEQIRRLVYRRIGGRPLTSIELVHLVQHLREKEPDMRVVRDWLNAHMEHSATSLQTLVSLEHQLQSELQVRCGNLVQSLHRLEREPWRTVFTRICHVEHLLEDDFLGEYRNLDAASQDVLRERVVRLAKRVRVPETLIAETAVRLACDEGARFVRDTLPPRSASSAYYLLDPVGVQRLHREIAQATKSRHLREAMVKRRPNAAYFTSGVIFFVAAMLLLFTWVSGGAVFRVGSVFAVLLALALPASEWVITLLHEAIVRTIKPVPLLRYDFSDGLPNDARTVVVLPVIWATVEDVDDAVDRLLVHYFANRERNISFALLSDYADSNEAIAPGDDSILEHAAKRIRELQAKYGTDKFYLFHRERRYNPVDHLYMGWERKRGKLVEFVEMLGGKRDTSYTVCLGDTSRLCDIRYVFTADLDTRLPFGVVSRLVGTMHLPYNRPRLNRDRTRVVEGYGVLQPTLSVTYESTQRSRFAALWAGELGIDPYAFAISNPYQDLFGQAVFVGKGVFDVQAFAETLVHRIPENHVLSHDVLEGGFLRTGLASDIEVVEEQPATVHAYQRRAHRWIRGDWQLLQWIGRACRDRNGERRPVDLCGVVRWHIVDHVRRSIMPPALFLIAWLAGVHVLPGLAAVWEAIVLLTVFAPFIKTLIDALLDRDVDVRSVFISFAQNVVQLLLLPFSAVIAMDAIVRTAYRLLVSRRHLLEWVPSAQMERLSGGTTLMYGPVGGFAIVLFIISMWFAGGTTSIVVGGVALALGIAVFPVVRWLNGSPVAASDAWVEAHKQPLFELAREIWSFYEQYVTEEDSWIPPDNVQFEPKATVAHRTSPTNIGLYMTSVLAARDMALINTETMLERLESTVRTVKAMEKWNGHLYNWYDTTTAEPLPPKYVSTVDSGNFVACLMVIQSGLSEFVEDAEFLRARLEGLTSEIEKLIQSTDFRPLYSGAERLFSLGYHVDRAERESVLYDLMASEARQASFVAIALGQIPVSHWFSLSRTMTRAQGRKTLLSWSGTMFEYLMPSILMRTYPHSVWDETYEGVVAKQRAYARAHGVPFGISESGYYAFDYQLNYQYRAFGVPGLGLDRGLERHLVVAPYAAILALPLARDASLEALEQFAEIGAKGPYGYYEAVDFTADRLPRGQRYEVIKSFMAHHQGMSLLTIANLLTSDAMVRRFHDIPEVKAAEFLLQERIPRKAAMIHQPAGSQLKRAELDAAASDGERHLTQTRRPLEVNVLSNGRMTSVLSSRGDGFLQWNNLNVTRWHDDPLVNPSGAILYIHDVASEEVWSATSFPESHGGGETVFRPDRATYTRKQSGIESILEVAIAPDDDVEIRRLQLRNRSDAPRVIEVTSFLELALANAAADQAHPAFSRLFVETSHDEQSESLLAKRRPRAADEQETWAVHTLFVAGANDAGYEFETMRSEFVGRGYSLANPKAIDANLRGTTGAVADPAFVVRRRIQLPPKGKAVVCMLTGVAQTRADAVDIVRRLREPRAISHVFHLAWIRAQIELRYAHMSIAQSMEAQNLAARLLFPAELSEARAQAIARNSLGQSALWSHGISGDAPILTVRLAHEADLPFVMTVARLHHHLLERGLFVDLAILDETITSYQEAVANALKDRFAANGFGDMKRVAVLKADRLSRDERTLLQAVSRVWLEAAGPSLRAQLEAITSPPRTEIISRPKDARRQSPSVAERAVPPVNRTRNADEGEFANGVGRFVDDGKAYRIDVRKGAYLGRPWTNVMANPKFGTLVTELGTGYTWWGNSREFKLTPWHNDPVLDPPAECLYVHDLGTNSLTSATPKPAGEHLSFQVTHAFGTTCFESSDEAFDRTMEVTVVPNDPVKLVRLVLRNRTASEKRVAVTYYLEWVLGVTRQGTSPFVVTDWDTDGRALVARNTYQETFRDAHAFLHMSAWSSLGASVGEGECSWTADRTEFVGGGSLAAPAGLAQTTLSNRTGTVMDACGAIRQVIDVPANGEATVVVIVGCAQSQEEVRELIGRYRDATDGSASQETKQYWHNVLGQIQVQTPDRSMDILLNGWLLYQTLACRLWARTAFYQAGGAFGYRDQLQDSLALLYVNPSLARAQILRNAAHQYVEGDVQHWWHEETGKGIRTKFSDDLLWLPYALSRYLEHTGDMTILNERIPFLTSATLRDDELERYEDTVVSDEMGTIVDHALRAIRHACRFGEHGLPLMGIGDWNDGMSRVGAKGRGESVWLAWFLLDVLKRFIPLGPDILSRDIVNEFRNVAEQIERCANEFAWDGVWFRRAFTDEGQWLGSIADRECRIDAIAQSWSVISDGTSKERQLRAMKSFDKELVDASLGVARLLTPAFDETNPSPGYIQGYPPGIRENGGQYTHGVIWSIVAWARLHQTDKAHALFSMLNPIHHTQSLHDIAIYGNEPYVMTADVYTAAAHRGQGGWSWYTGAAGWMYQAGLESVLGVMKRADRLYIRPCVPEDWSTFRLTYRYGDATYQIEVECRSQDEDVSPIWMVDGQQKAMSYLQLVDDGKVHHVSLQVGRYTNLETVG